MRVQHLLRAAQQLRAACGTQSCINGASVGAATCSAASQQVRSSLQKLLHHSFGSSATASSVPRQSNKPLKELLRILDDSVASAKPLQGPVRSCLPGGYVWRRSCSAAAFTATKNAAQTTAVGGASYALAASQHSLAAGMSHSSAKQIAVWLSVSAGWVASMVVLGGVTRLTRSGLSMTDWKFSGERPPQSQEDWEEEFAKYRLSPEFKKVNSSMQLDEFKFIYWMEYSHRMWGRALGLVFAIPAAVFVARGAVTARLGTRLGLLFLMGGTQGLVGWWMVKSGLQQPETEHDAPKVSPYRLAAHLASAFSIYAVLLWTALSLAAPISQLTAATPLVQANATRLRNIAIPLSLLIAVTASSGAFVAGLDAGHAYNTFPLMGGHLIPEEYRAQPGWRNAFENTAAVQFHHRVLALATLAAVGATWLRFRGVALPRTSHQCLTALTAVTAGQVVLGISTLLMHVPVSLGAAHQANALALFTAVLALLHSIRHPLGAASPIARAFTPLAAAATVGVWAVVLRADEVTLAHPRKAATAQ